jgi:hypothetical protein
MMIHTEQFWYLPEMCHWHSQNSVVCDAVLSVHSSAGSSEWLKLFLILFRA